MTSTLPDLSSRRNGAVPPATGSGVEPGRRRRRGVGDRLTAGTVAGLAAALLTFVIAGSILRDRRDMVTVAVAVERIPAGATISESMVRASEMPANVDFASTVVRFDRLQDGLVAGRTIQSGEPLVLSAIGEPGRFAGVRTMAIPLDSWQAAGGEVQVGDEIDVIDTGADGPRYVLSGAPVSGRSGGDAGRGLGGSISNGSLWLTVEVTEAEALQLAAVIESGKLAIVRSTGAGESVDG